VLIVLTLSSSAIRQQEKNRFGDRPIYNERDRVEVLSALRAVDHVVVFDDVNCLAQL
jgi:bifunctional ADP-heptose synthase (sugar kinase/adenylyltransferase)